MSKENPDQPSSSDHPTPQYRIFEGWTKRAGQDIYYRIEALVWPPDGKIQVISEFSATREELDRLDINADIK